MITSAVKYGAVALAIVTVGGGAYTAINKNGKDPVTYATISCGQDQIQVTLNADKPTAFATLAVKYAPKIAPAVFAKANGITGDLASAMILPTKDGTQCMAIKVPAANAEPVANGVKLVTPAPKA